MPKATVKLATGAVINIEGTTSEIKDLLQVYGAVVDKPLLSPKPPSGHQGSPKKLAKEGNDSLSISEVVKHIKDCDEADDIETRILDTTSQVNRILLPLYIVQKYMDYKDGLTTGDISAITNDLGIPIHVANVSNSLKGSAARYVIGDQVRRKGQPVHYTLSRRGIKYLENVIKGKSDGE
ncbi:MAG: hypothetical protein IPK56_05170 [Elusimicrobia bacterium]|nr:hypothetical protein [Elusimicrobiota bacterium]MBK9056690.1 hypothetical protein [Elusimicrobiota bacterium]